MKNMKKSFLGVFFILLLFLLSVSSNASGKLNRSNATLMVRSTLQLKLTGVSGTVKWSSSNNKIAKVDKTGKSRLLPTEPLKSKPNTLGKPILAWQHDYRKEDPGEQDRLAEDSSPWSRECGIPDGKNQPSL